jgi:enamine deaminase RidA (YjgF/YER057c/UK114 family)
MTMSIRRKIAVAGVAATVLAGGGGVASAAPHGTGPRPPGPTEVRPALPAGQNFPNIAGGVAFGTQVPLYQMSGIGPSAVNTSAPAGSPERYIDFPGGQPPPGVTITEAQGVNALRAITANLAAQGLTHRDVISMRVFLANPPGEDIADFNGWNRAYRQFYANTDLATGAVVDVPLGSAPPGPPMFANPARPSRVALEVENLPVAGWLVEVEVVAAFGRR